MPRQPKDGPKMTTRWTQDDHNMAFKMTTRWLQDYSSSQAFREERLPMNHHLHPNPNYWYQRSEDQEPKHQIQRPNKLLQPPPAAGPKETTYRPAPVPPKAVRVVPPRPKTTGSGKRKKTETIETKKALMPYFDIMDDPYFIKV